MEKILECIVKILISNCFNLAGLGSQKTAKNINGKKLFSVYVDFDPTDESLIEVEFNFAGRALRRWQIKNTFVECSSNLRPPSGCLQYFTKAIGQFSTFNFEAQADKRIHLAGQRYNICIQRMPSEISIISECNKIFLHFYLL